MLEKLLNACSNGDLEALKKLPESAFIRDEDDSDSPLMVALRCGQKNIVQWLLENKKAEINATNDNKETALIVALKNPQQAKDFVAMLLQHEDINLHIQSYFWGTPLTDAIFLKRFDVAGLLLGKEKSFQLSNHPGALHWAVAHNHDELVLRFIDLKVDLNSTKYTGFEEPEDWVWKSMPSASPFRFREKDITPLLIALKKGDLSMIDLLLKNGADPNCICKEEAPLVVAAKNGDMPSLKMLLEQGANLELSINPTQTIKEAILNDESIEERIKQFISEQPSKDILPSKHTSNVPSFSGHFFSKLPTNKENELEKELIKKISLLLQEMSTNYDCSFDSIKNKIPNILSEIGEQSISSNPVK